MFPLRQTSAEQLSLLPHSLCPQLREVSLLSLRQCWGSTFFPLRRQNDFAWLLTEKTKPQENAVRKELCKQNVFGSLIEALHAHANVKLNLLYFPLCKKHMRSIFLHVSCYLKRGTPLVGHWTLGHCRPGKNKSLHLPVSTVLLISTGLLKALGSGNASWRACMVPAACAWRCCCA